METVIILSVVGILLVGCWHVGNVSQRYWKQLETDPESVVLIERKWDWAIWGPFLIATVTAWVAPVWAGYAVAAYMIYWATDWVWFKYIDWYVATCQREEPDTAYQAPDPIRREWARPANAIIATGRAGHWCFPDTGRMT